MRKKKKPRIKIGEKKQGLPLKTEDLNDSIGIVNNLIDGRKIMLVWYSSVYSQHIYMSKCSNESNVISGGVGGGGGELQ